jgi:hypothetical protein
MKERGSVQRIIKLTNADASLAGHAFDNEVIERLIVGTQCHFVEAFDIPPRPLLVTGCLERFELKTQSLENFANLCSLEWPLPPTHACTKGSGMAVS